MSIRLEPFLNESIYHIFNRTIDGRSIFKNKSNCILFLKIIEYYRSTKAKVSYSKYKRLPLKTQLPIFEEISNLKYYRIELLSYCLMPTHFHLLLRQKTDKGITSYISDIINSFTRTFNLSISRKGPLFMPKFKSTSVQKDEQLIHTSGYIHLNPYSGGVVDNPNRLFSYSWSSLPEYLNKPILCNTNTVLSYFNGNTIRYQEFILDNADYQKYLEDFKYTEKW